MVQANSSTTDALRRHLFGHSTYPLWNGCLDQLLVGIEVEYLIAHIEDDTRLMRRSEFEQFLQLMKPHGYSHRHSHGQTERVSKDVTPGFIVIEPDFAYHVLELAFPPRSDPAVLRAMIEPTLAEVDVALKSLGFRRLPTGVVEFPRKATFDSVNLGRLKGFVEGLEQHSSEETRKDKYFLPNFGAYFAATHIHLNAATSPESLKTLPALYEVEWLAHALFSRCQEIDGMNVGNARALTYMMTFPETYELVHVPRSIPRNLEDLAACYERSIPRLFPAEPILGVKDMSVIRPKPFGTLEFRSACSMPSVSDLLAVAAYRIAQMAYGQHFQNDLVQAPDGWQRAATIDIARRLPSEPNIAAAMALSKQRLVAILDTIPLSWARLTPDISGTSMHPNLATEARHRA